MGRRGFVETGMDQNGVRPVSRFGRRVAWFLLGVGLSIALGACVVRKKANDVADAVKQAAVGVGGAAEGLSKQTGAALGILPVKPVDYVRMAYGRGEAPGASGAYSLAEERLIGRLIAAEIASSYRLYEHPSMIRYLNLVAASVCAFSDRPEWPCAVGILKTETIVCYGLPGGYVLVSLGALRACESESELAGVLAQALAHGYLKHSLVRMELLHAKLLNQPASHPLAPMTKSSDADFKVLIEGEAERLIKDGFEPKDIHAADRKSTDWLIRVGYEPGGLKAYLARVQVRLRGRTELGILPEHKVYEAREQVISQRLAELHAPTRGRALPDRFIHGCSSRLPASIGS